MGGIYLTDRTIGAPTNKNCKGYPRADPASLGNDISKSE